MTSLFKRALLTLACALPCAFAAEDDLAAATLTKVGQIAPDFTATTLTGEQLTLSKLRGRVVVLSFFATWCGPCKVELPHVEKEIWQAYRNQGLVVVGIDREEPAAVVAPFVKKMELSFPVAADADRKIYARFATAYIPRAYVIAPDGAIAFQSVGNGQDDFNRLISAVKAQLAKPVAK